MEFNIFRTKATLHLTEIKSKVIFIFHQLYSSLLQIIINSVSLLTKENGSPTKVLAPFSKPLFFYKFYCVSIFKLHKIDAVS